ncbi:MAG TPA: HD domain-containing protein [Chthonomonadaceae bacterium]|nr:HD domain-containing protein [Chthonomonadaceae bacterium]
MAQRPWSQDTYLKAYLFAANAHLGQLVPGTEISYLMHLSIVAMEVIAALRHEPGHEEELAVQCALLHDVIEDTAVTFEQVATAFGPAVAAGVGALTKRKQASKAEAMADSLSRIRQQPREVWLVKLADRICNLQPPPHYWTSEKRIAYREEARQILEALGGASAYLAARLAHKIDAYGDYIAGAGG